MRARLRRWLDRIVEPPRVYSGRHALGVPVPARRFDFWAHEWAADQWADIATRHGIEAS